ncbi:AMP-binding protein [Pikeienuella piscinae]|uniref:Long-chain-fatty-acid--CoA ligase n=1 Tax=Pikeienuella piscinae TaxID=2748098 RepID=A0A7L5BXM2_9RHOB|nr:AMP-binding protein [Pikeienuella piscinae]QIE56675.1 AMP-binding protein [Pikeienuella piscinae]
MPGMRLPAPQPLAQVLTNLARERGDRDVIIQQDGVRTSVAEIDTLARRLAGWLADRGIGRGDRVAVWLPNHPVWMGLFFACARLGATLVSINPRYRKAELEHVLSKSSARMLVFSGPDGHTDFGAEIAALDGDALPDLEALAIFRPGDAASAAIPQWPVTELDPDALHATSTPALVAELDDPLILFTTSGTTSAAKLVTHTHRTIYAHMTGCAPFFGFGDGAAYLAVLPFCGVFGLTASLCSLWAGNPIITIEAYSTQAAADLMHREHVTHMFGSDDMFVRIWRRDRSAYAKAIYCGFARFTPGIEKELTDMARAGVPIVGLYGASEINALFAGQPASLPVEERLLGGGVPAHPDAKIRIRDQETNELLAPGEIGVLEVLAPTNFVGYFRNPEATAKTIDPEGYVNTSDLCRIREDGSFVYVGRNGDVLRLSGFLTDPAEIEEAIETHPGVEKAQVVGVTEKGRTRSFAFVITDGGIFDEKAVIAEVAGRLAHYKVPLAIVALDEFPTVESANGLKIRKEVLKRMAQQAVDQSAE